jgi:hypothetical protein
MSAQLPLEIDTDVLPEASVVTDVLELSGSITIYWVLGSPHKRATRGASEIDEEKHSYQPNCHACGLQTRDDFREHLGPFLWHKSLTRA